MNKSTEINIPGQDRYSRLDLLKWWNRETIRQAAVMVVGAGALGNEVLKNLALLGIGKIFLVDFDQIEISNLTRSILFRAKDQGKTKTTAAAHSIKDINPDVAIKDFAGDIDDVGLGIFMRVDLVIGCLDNREARLKTNRGCWQAKKPYIDGAIGGLYPFSGCVRIFIPPHSACYECSWTKEDYRNMAHRYSCSQIQPPAGHIPTTPTEASIIAAMQVQEALKILHHMKVQGGKGIFYGGMHHKIFTVEYQKRRDCLSHVHLDHDKIIQLKEKSHELTVNRLLEIAAGYLGKSAILELDRDIVLELECKNCHLKERVYKSKSKICLCPSCLECPECGKRRIPGTTYWITKENDFQNLTLSDIGMPALHVFKARNGEQILYFEITKDREKVMNFL
jgi:adenylyltransferase/sulfurtransferase